MEERKGLGELPSASREPVPYSGTKFDRHVDKHALSPIIRHDKYIYILTLLR